MPHTGLAATDATVLWVEVATLLSLAWLLGLVARRLGQPPIVGSLLAGLLAGPSVFGQVWPAGFQWFRPATQLHAGVLAAVADFSLLFLLIVLGAETDLRLIRRSGRAAASVILSSLVLPLAAGCAVAAVMPAEFLGGEHDRVSFILLMAAAMSVSSLPVIARIVTEMGITRRNIGQLSIAAATVNDAVGFVVLAVAIALVGTGGAGSLILAVGGLAALVVVLVTVGQRGVDALLRRSRSEGPDISAGVAVSVVFTLIIAAIAQALGVDAALGAFLAGIVLGRSRYLPRRALDAIEWASNAVFAPLYFATAGLSVNVALLGHGSTAWWFVIAFAVAVASKFAGVAAGARVGGVPAREATGLGIVLNGRGALQVILATAGLVAGVLSPSAFTVIILMSIASSVVVPPALRRALRGWSGTLEEQERLEHEAKMTSNVVVRGQRLLLPTRGTSNSIAAARILDLAWPSESEVTLLHLATTDRDEDGVNRVRQMLEGRTVRDEATNETDVIAAILAEANLGYGAIAVGAADRTAERRVLPRPVEQLLNLSPIPLLLVRRGSAVRTENGCPVIRPRQILVPITGNAASRAGQEVAQMISRNTGAELSLMHVVTRQPGTRSASPSRSADAVLVHARRDAAGQNLSVEPIAAAAASAGDEIVAEASKRRVDLVVLGTTVRRVEDEPFLGHTVEQLLDRLTDPTVVIVVLPDAQQAVADEHIDRRAG